MSEASHGTAKQSTARIINATAKEAAQKMLAAFFRRLWLRRRDSASCDHEPWDSRAASMGTIEAETVDSDAPATRSAARAAPEHEPLASIVATEGLASLPPRLTLNVGNVARGAVWRLRDDVESNDGSGNVENWESNYQRIRSPAPLPPANLKARCFMHRGGRGADVELMRGDDNVRAKLMPMTFDSVYRAWSKAFGRVRGGKLYHLCESVAFAAWLAEENAKRAAQDLLPETVHTLKNTGCGTRQNIGTFAALTALPYLLSLTHYSYVHVFSRSPQRRFSSWNLFSTRSYTRVIFTS